MNTIERIKNLLAPRADRDEIADITVGRIYAAVSLKSGALGLAHLEGAHNARAEASSSPLPKGAGDLTELLSLLGGDDPFASVLASAAASALAAADKADLPEGDVIDRLAVRPGERVVMVGGFPIEAALRERGAILSIFDRSRGIGETDDLPASLAGADLVVITATTIGNNTIDGILGHIQRARETVILGPSTILEPEAFRGTPVTGLFGIIIQDAAAVTDSIARGGGTRDFIRHAKKVEAAVPHG